MPSQIFSSHEVIPFRPNSTASVVGSSFVHKMDHNNSKDSARITFHQDNTGINAKTKELLGIVPKVPGHVCGIYCTECEIARKKSRTLLLSTGGDMFINDISVSGWEDEEDSMTITTDHSAHHRSSSLRSNHQRRSDSFISNNNNNNSNHNNHNRKSNLVVNVSVPHFDTRTHRLVISVNLETKKISDDLNIIARNLSQLKDSGWYFETLNYQDAQNLLAATAPGTFLLRNSSDSRYLFSLSVQTDRGPTSVRINYINGKFQLDADEKFNEVLPKNESVIALLELHLKTARRTGQVWVEPNGKYYSPVLLSQPLKRKVPTLQHLSRVVLNRASPSSSAVADTIDQAKVPPGIRNYLAAYPFRL